MPASHLRIYHARPFSALKGTVAHLDSTICGLFISIGANDGVRTFDVECAQHVRYSVRAHIS